MYFVTNTFASDKLLMYLVPHIPHSGKDADAMHLWCFKSKIYVVIFSEKKQSDK